MIKLSQTTTGTVLFALDALLLLLVWPVALWASRSTAPDILDLPFDVRGIAYPLFDLLLLFAMGLYRRDALQQTGRSLSRVPLVVGMGAALVVLLSWMQPWLMPGAAIPSGRDQMVMFSSPS